MLNQIQKKKNHLNSNILNNEDRISKHYGPTKLTYKVIHYTLSHQIVCLSHDPLLLLKIFHSPQSFLPWKEKQLIASIIKKALL